MRRVHLVRGGGGGGSRPRDVRREVARAREDLRASRFTRETRRRRGEGLLAALGAISTHRPDARATLGRRAPPPLPPSRTNWTRLVPPSRTNWTRLNDFRAVAAPPPRDASEGRRAGGGRRAGAHEASQR